MEEFEWFEVCRVCATPKTIIPLTSLFDDDGEKTRMLKLISGIDITIDEGKRNAMICDDCFERVKQALTVRTELIDSEEQYFKICRDEEDEEQEAGGLRAKQKAEEAGGSVESNVKEEGQETCGSGELSVIEGPIGTKQEDDATDYSMEGDADSHDCRICHKSYKDKFGLRRHLSADHDDVTKGRFKCKQCSKIYFFKSSLVSHIASHKDRYPNSKPKKSLEPKEMLKRDKMIARARGSGAKCKICQKSFADKAGLLYHLSSNHAETTNALFQCDRCPKKFHFESHLRKHLVNHRGFQSWYQCPEKDCGRFLQSEFHLIQHMISHSDVRPFVCWCMKAFKFAHTLRQHQRHSHPEANHSRLNCPVGGCMQSFDHQFDLHQHFIVHPGYRPFYDSKGVKTEARPNHSPTM